jgi:hypothetical protein
MPVIGYMLFVAGCVVGLAGDIMFLVIAYKRSVWWFLGCLFIPIVSLIFFFMHFRTTVKAVGLSVLGIVVALVGWWMTGFGFAGLG